MKAKKIDGKYNKEHDYLKEMEKFTRKDMLLLSLHQEWVRSRYNKPNNFKWIQIGILIAMFSLSWSIDAVNQGVHITLFVMTLSLLFITLFEPGEREKSEVNKLNSIREAINEFCKDDCK